MGIPGRLAGDRAQAETERGVEAGGADPPVIQADLLALAVFEEQLAVIGVGQRRRDDPLDASSRPSRLSSRSKKSRSVTAIGWSCAEPAGPVADVIGAPAIPAWLAAPGSISRERGRRITAVVPFPGRLASVSSPPWAATSARQK